jgi:hypothetical protein
MELGFPLLHNPRLNEEAAAEAQGTAVRDPKYNQERLKMPRQQTEQCPGPGSRPFV